MKDISKCFHTLLPSDITVKSTYASNVEYIILKLKNGRTENETMKLEPKKMNFDAAIPAPKKLLKTKTNRQKKETIEMQGFQLPMVVNTATTVHKLQGTGVDNIFIHCWHYCRNWPYVVLSRVKHMSGLYLRKKIDRNRSKYALDEDLVVLLNYLNTLLPQQIDYEIILN